jgi:predicted ribosome quality control (RQC) complex YloA/Tae2 family protein
VARRGTGGSANATPPSDDAALPAEDYLVEEVDGYTVVVGRNARANDRLSAKLARPRDLWLHAAGVPGSHVVVRVASEAPEPPKAVVEAAAALAVKHSKARDARGKVPVHLCRGEDVRKRRGAPPGQVTLRRYETLGVYARRE